MSVSRFRAIVALGVASLGASTAAGAQSFNAEPIRAGVFIYNATKAYRIEKLGPEYNFRTNPKGHRFSYHMKLSMVAQQYAEHLARTNAGGHTADGRTPQQRVEQAGIKHCGVSENVYSSWTTPTAATWRSAADQAMAGWKASAPHEANLRRTTVNAMGAASAGWKHGDQWHYRFVQIFINDCEPADRPSQFPKRAASR